MVTIVHGTKNSWLRRNEPNNLRFAADSAIARRASGKTDLSRHR